MKKEYQSKTIKTVTVTTEENQVTIQSQRLVFKSLNQLKENDLIDFYSKLFFDEDNIKLFGEGKVWNPEQVKEFVQEEIEHWSKGKFGVFAVFDTAGAFVGNLYVHHAGDEFAKVNKQHQNAAEIGYILDKSFWGKGYGTEIAIVGKKYIKHVVAHEPKDSLFGSINEIVATVEPTNEGSAKILRHRLKGFDPTVFERFNGNKRVLFFKPLKVAHVEEFVEPILEAKL